jgi:F0F1-type ATP synthase membrane subunit c/vacuolar-type H+-ATPase subunit K
MLSPGEMEKINKGWTIVNIIWMAMLLSLLVYLVVGLAVADEIDISIEESVFQTIRSVLYVVSFVTLIATKFIRKIVLSGKGQGNITGAYQQSDQKTASPLLAKYTTAMIIALAMSESIGVYGLVLFFLGKNQFDLYLLIMVSAGAMLYYRPKKEEIISMG